jgi:DNA ligase-1
MKIFPTLYKKSSTGKIQQWTISVADTTITTVHGQVNGKLQETSDVISEGKNIGKKNETTAAQQAEAEAQSKYEKQLKKGYVTTMDDATNDRVDELIEGGIIPMLAHKYSEQAHKIKYPAFVQPKLDGIRCIAIVKDGVATLWSRTRKPITSCPHIVQELEAAFENQDIVLDGELYNHEMKADFEKIVSLVRQEEPGEGHEIVQYHVYDTVSDEAFKNRYAQLHRLFCMFEFYSLKLVQTEVAKTEDDVMLFFDKYRAQGYEGAMMRNIESLYANKRSYDLQKVKEFDDAEYPIIGIEEGRGKLAGHAIFICKTEEGKEFLAKMKGETSQLKRFFEDAKLWEGKKLTVQYQGLTGKEKVPRFPVGVAIRDYE